MKNPLKSKSFKILKEKGFKRWVLYRFVKLQHIVFFIFPSLYKPLPKNYKFAFFAYPVSGHMALGNFLSLCGLKQARLYTDNKFKY